MRISKYIYALAWCALLLASARCAKNDIPALGTAPQSASGTPTPVPPYLSQTSHLIASLPTPVPIETDQGGQAVIKWTAVEDPKSEFNKTNGTFIVKESGLYTVSAVMSVSAPMAGWTAGEYCKIILLSLKKGALTINTSTAPSGNAACSVSAAATVPLPAGDGIFVIAVAVTGHGGTTTGGAAGTNGYDPYTVFTVVRVSD